MGIRDPRDGRKEVYIPRGVEWGLCRKEGRRRKIHYVDPIKRGGVVFIAWAKGKENKNRTRGK